MKNVLESKEGADHPQNTFLLLVDVHRYFDAHFFGILVRLPTYDMLSDERWLTGYCESLLTMTTMSIPYITLTRTCLGSSISKSTINPFAFKAADKSMVVQKLLFREHFRNALYWRVMNGGKN